MSRWEDSTIHRAKTVGRAPLDDDLKRSVLLKIRPDAEEKKLRSMRMMYKAYETLRTRVLELVNERSRGLAPTLYHITEEDLEPEEEGERLMRIEMKNGQKQPV